MSLYIVYNLKNQSIGRLSAYRLVFVLLYNILSEEFFDRDAVVNFFVFVFIKQVGAGGGN